jgi:hypothetical protein
VSGPWAGVVRILGAVLAVALALALGACSGDPGDEDPRGTTTSSTPQGDPTTEGTETTSSPSQPRPRRGECRALGWAAALAPTSHQRTVPCARRHTAETYFVGRLDLHDDEGHRLGIDAPSVQAQPRRACTRRLAPHLGVAPDRLRLSMAQAVWFTPSVEDSHAGADWFRCDVVVVERDERLLPLPRRTARSGAREDFGMCATAEPGTAGFRRVACSAPHTWRALTTVDLPGRTLPTDARAAELMESPCRTAARSEADDPLDFRWSEERPTREQWAAGRRYGICWVPTGA